MEDQAWDAEVPELPQATCLVEVLKECERAVAGEEIYQVAGDGGHSIKDASAWGRSCRSGCSGRCLRSVNLWGGKSGGRRGGCSSLGYHRALRWYIYFRNEDIFFIMSSPLCSLRVFTS